jgi:hypothetical protein
MLEEEEVSSNTEDSKYNSKDKDKDNNEGTEDTLFLVAREDVPLRWDEALQSIRHNDDS